MRILKCIASVALALSLVPGAALADDTSTAAQTDAATGSQTQAQTQAQARTCERTFAYLAGEAPSIPETFTEDGTTWTLAGVAEPVVDATFTPATKTFTHADRATFETLEAAHEAFPDTWQVDEAGFAGEIPQTAFAVREITGTYLRVDDVASVYGPYPTNDVAQLPEGSETCSIAWTVLETNALGRPVSYEATVTEKVETPVTYVASYDVEVAYEGTLAKDEQRLTVVATYTADAGAGEASDDDAASAHAANATRNGIPWGGVGGAGAALYAYVVASDAVEGRGAAADKDGGGQAKEHKKPWQETMITPEEVRQFLADHVLLRYNVITGRPEFRVPEKDPMAPLSSVFYPTGQSPLDEWRSPTEWHTVNDRFVTTVWGILSNWKQTRESDVWRVIKSDFVPLYNPLVRYLEGLPPWDGQSNPILDLASTVTVRGGPEEQLLFYVWLRKWLVAMVASWVDERVVNETILVLVGRQGSYKSKWFSALMPPELQPYFHSTTSFGEMGKDEILKISQYGLICCEELDAMKDKEMNRLKWAVTTTVTDERRPYAHYSERRSHIASYCGTGNNIQFLSDPSGNRRWMPFEVEWITSPREIPFDYAAIYAQAYGLYKRGYQYWLSETDEEWQRTHNEQFEAPNLEQELVEVFFYPPANPTQGEFMPVSRALQVIGGYVTVKLSASVLGSAFTKQGFQSMRTKHSRGYIVVQRSGDEIKSRLQMLASQFPTELVTGDG